MNWYKIILLFVTLLYPLIATSERGAFAGSVFLLSITALIQVLIIILTLSFYSSTDFKYFRKSTWPFFIWLLLAAISISYSPVIGASIRRIISILSYYLLGFFVFKQFNKSKHELTLINFIILSSIYPIILGVVQMISNNANEAYYVFGRIRITSIFTNSNEYGLFLNTILLFSYYKLKTLKIGGSIRYIVLGYLSLIVISLLHTFSRTAILSLILATLFVRLRKSFIAFLIPTLLITMFVYFTPDNIIVQRFLGEEQKHSIIWRLKQWDYALEIWEKAPIFGNGIESFFVSSVYGNFSSLSLVNAFAASTHNEYIKIMVEMGLVGLFFYLLFFFYVAFIYTKKIESHKMAITLIPLMLLISSFTRNLIGVPLLQFYLFISLGIIIRSIYSNEKDIYIQN